MLDLVLISFDFEFLCRYFVCVNYHTFYILPFIEIYRYFRLKQCRQKTLKHKFITIGKIKKGLTSIEIRSYYLPAAHNTCPLLFTTMGWDFSPNTRITPHKHPGKVILLTPLSIFALHSFPFIFASMPLLVMWFILIKHPCKSVLNQKDSNAEQTQFENN